MIELILLITSLSISWWGGIAGTSELKNPAVFILNDKEL